MAKRIDDMLVLVSRVQEQRGDIRSVLRQDREVAAEVHTYLDDVNWLVMHADVAPRRSAMLANREQLLATLHHAPQGRYPSRPARALGAAVTAGLLLGLAFSARLVPSSLPQPVAEAFGGFLRPHQASATTVNGEAGSSPSTTATQADQPLLDEDAFVSN